MKELFRTNNPTVVSYVSHLLDEAGLKAFVLDTNVSVIEGSIGILPRRIMVIDDDLEAAQNLLREVDLEHELKV